MPGPFRPMGLVGLERCTYSCTLGPLSEPQPQAPANFMKHVLLGLTACFLTVSASAQYFKCGTDQMRAKLIAADPTYLQREAEYEEEIQRLIANSSERGDREVVITIPIVFHIV